MSRLIDADEFIKDAYPLEGVPLERVKNAPTIDAVAVIRCKDCKYWDGTWCDINEAYFEEDDFCSYGKREEETK